MASRALALKPDMNIPATPVPVPSPPDGTSPLAKRYTVPPRPKPGRKPATDTPPTRRKAQNRAAQRAFRERRAAKVNELEGEMGVLQRQHEAEIAKLRNKYDSDLLAYQDQVKTMADEFISLQDRNANLESLLATNTVGSISDEDAQKSYHTPPSIQDGCGNCTTASRCQCIDDAFEVNIAVEQKRPLPPNSISEVVKRPRTMEQEGLETDFTTYQAPIMKPQDTVEVMSDSQIEPCGFCSDGSACLCAEIAADQARSRETTYVKEESSPGTNSSCANGPGSCDTCKTSPVISVMCHSLNATQPRQLQVPTQESNKAGPCALGEDCCRVSDTMANNQTSSSPNQNRSIKGPTLTCADAFSTLSQHKAFEKASKELGDWLPLLKTVPARSHDMVEDEQKVVVESLESIPSLAANIAGKTGFEIEAASVLSVLQFYDTRYATNIP